MKATYIEVEAEVRYWEDATVNGQEDTTGTLMPFRFGDKWCPTIRLEDGWIVNWPEGHSRRHPLQGVRPGRILAGR